MQNELRRACDSQEWSLISEIEPSSVGCALCPASEERTEEKCRIENTKGKWEARCITDPYPFTHPSMFKSKVDGFCKSFSAHGWSEIVVETREHTKEFHELSPEEIKNVLLVYQKRIAELKTRENVEFIGIIKDNMQVEFSHAYSKLFTLPIVPEYTKEKIVSFNDYKFKNEKCLYCDILSNESASPRLVFENENFSVFAPFSQKNANETWIVPKKHVSCITELNEFEIFSLAETIKNLLTRFSVISNPFRYGMVYHMKPKNESDFHFHIEVFQKTIPSSLKEGYSINLCKITPENTAKMLRGK